MNGPSLLLVVDVDCGDDAPHHAGRGRCGKLASQFVLGSGRQLQGEPPVTDGIGPSLQGKFEFQHPRLLDQHHQPLLGVGTQPRRHAGCAPLPDGMLDRGQTRSQGQQHGIAGVSNLQGGATGQQRVAFQSSGVLDVFYGRGGFARRPLRSFQQFRKAGGVHGDDPPLGRGYLSDPLGRHVDPAELHRPARGGIFRRQEQAAGQQADHGGGRQHDPRYPPRQPHDSRSAKELSMTG